MAEHDTKLRREAQAEDVAQSGGERRPKTLQHGCGRLMDQKGCPDCHCVPRCTRFNSSEAYFELYLPQSFRRVRTLWHSPPELLSIGPLLLRQEHYNGARRVLISMQHSRGKNLLSRRG